MKDFWKYMEYNGGLDCWVVFWGDNTGYKVCCVIGLSFILGMAGNLRAGWN